jgi:hypothetical protein
LRCWSRIDFSSYRFFILAMAATISSPDNRLVAKEKHA